MEQQASLFDPMQPPLFVLPSYTEKQTKFTCRRCRELARLGDFSPDGRWQCRSCGQINPPIGPTYHD